MSDLLCLFDAFPIPIVWLGIYNGMSMWHGPVAPTVVHYIGETGDGRDSYIGLHLQSRLNMSNFNLTPSYSSMKIQKFKNWFIQSLISAQCCIVCRRCNFLLKYFKSTILSIWIYGDIFRSAHQKFCWWNTH